MQFSPNDTILIVDSHDAIIEGLVFMLKKRNPGVTIYKALSVKRAKILLRTIKIDIAILGVFSKGSDDTEGISLCKHIKPKFEHTKIICHINFCATYNLKNLLQINVDAIIAKYDGVSALMQAIAAIKNGQHFYSQEITEAFSAIFNNLTKPVINITLTKRQRQIVELIARAKSNKEISEELLLTEKTTEAHITKIAKTLGIQRASKIEILYKLGKII